jgi:hypothetical protein
MEHLPIQERTSKPTLEDVRHRFETWREGKKHGSRIPKCLWAAAVEVCSEHRVAEVSRALGLNYNELKGRLSGRALSAEKQIVSGPEFLELSLGLEAPPVLCSVEIENAAGGKLKMTFSGKCRDFDPMELARVFRGGGR